MALLQPYSPLAGGNPLVGGIVTPDTLATSGLGGPSLTSVMGGPPSLTAVPGPQGGAPTTFGAGVTPPTGFTVPPDQQPPPDPAAQAAEKAAEGMENIQKGLLSFEERALRAEEAMGAKLGDWQSYMAATMKPFQPPQQTPMAAQWGSAAMIFAALGSLFTRRPLTTALNAMAGVMKAYREGDQKNLDNSMEIWKANSEQAMKLADFEMQAYRTALEGIHTQIDLKKEITETQMNEAVAKLMATGAAFNDDTAMNVAMSSGVPGFIDLVQKRIDARAKYAEASGKIQENYAMDRAIKEFLASPEAKNMTQQQIADQIKLIRNPYSAGSTLAPEDIHSRALLWAAGHREEAEKDLPYGATRAQLIAQIEHEGNQIDPETAQTSPVVQNWIRATGQVTEEKRLANLRATMAIRANNALQASQRVVAASAALPRGTLVPANFIQMKLWETESKPALRNYYIAVNSLSTEYAAALNNGIPRVYDKQHAIDMINIYASHESIEAAVKALQRELQIALNSPGQVEDLILKHPTEAWGDLLLKQEQASETKLGAGGGGPAVGEIQDGFRFKGGDPKDENNWERVQ